MSKDLIISVASSRTATKWTRQNITWLDFVKRLEVPVKSTETMEQYLKLSKSEQDNLKDVGGYIGGELIENSRKKGILSRQLLVLDLDNIPAGQTENLLKKLNSLNFSYVIHSTRKHTEYSPRLRVISILDKPVGPEEYIAIIRMFATFINIEYCDHTTFQPNRLMYWPSCCSDSSYIYQYDNTKPAINAKGMLDLYTNAGLDWKDANNWPTVSTEKKEFDRILKKQENPLEKKGPIGAFCKSYTILEAIEKFLPDIYEPCGTDDNRLTYTGGSTSGGALVYEDVFLYSYHATDPASEILCNAFDLVRIHKFGHLDDEYIKPKTRHDAYPSFKEMVKLIREDPQARLLLAEEDFGKAIEKTGQEISEDDKDWMRKLKLTDGNRFESSRENITIILENESGIKGKLRYEEFTKTMRVLGSLPWNPSEEIRKWLDIDEVQLRMHLDKKYKITGEKKIEDALKACFDNNRYNEVHDYFNNLEWDGEERVRTLLIKFLGAEDNIFTREAIEKFLMATVARGLKNGIKWDNLLVLVGEQGIGKSTLGRMLGMAWFSDSLYTFEGKEAFECIDGKLIVEIGELHAMNKSEASIVKQFLSKSEDSYRRPYAKIPETHPRHCTFLGTTNNYDFLKDETGNRRFWPIDVWINEPTKNLWADLPPILNQVWAEIVFKLKRGDSLLLSKEALELANIAADEHMEVDPREEEVYKFLEKEIPENWYDLNTSAKRAFLNKEKDFEPVEPIPQEKKIILMRRTYVTAAEVWVECFSKDMALMYYKEARAINKILLRLKNWKRDSKRRFIKGYKKAQGFIRIE